MREATQKTEFQDYSRSLGRLLSWSAGLWISQGEQNRLSVEDDVETLTFVSLESRKEGREYRASETPLLFFQNLVLKWHLYFNNMLALEK